MLTPHPIISQHAFVYIRQLALHLRAAVTTQTKEAYRVVYGWQFMNGIRLWSAVVSNLPAAHELRDLAYPLTSIVLGVASLLPTARHLPARLHCVRMLQQLSAATETLYAADACDADCPRPLLL